MKILLLHGIRDLQSLRRTTLNQSFCLLKHAPEHEYTLHCFGQTVGSELRERDFDAIVIDTTFLWYRWARPRSVLAELMEEYQFVGDSHAAKVALPQDDYDHAEILDQWLAAWRVDAIFSPLAKHAALLFPLAALRARVLPCFAGHLDPADREIASCFNRPFEAREIDVGYRAAKLPAQFGRIGRVKSEIGQRFVQALGPNHGLRLDISIDPRGVLSGERWLHFLCNSRFTLGSASGSSLLDPQGRIMDAVRDYERDHPGASFEEIEAACFPGQDGERELAGIGPRNIETALAESCQILVPSAHLAPFEPNVHYISLASDCSNIADVRRQMRDTTLVKQRISAALELVCETPSFRTENLTQRILAEVERIRGCYSPAMSQSSDVLPSAYAMQSLLAEQKITLRLAEAEIDSASAAADSEKRSLNWKLSLRTGRFGGLREMLGVNDALLPFGVIDPSAPRTHGLRVYLLLRRARDCVGAARALFWQGRDLLPFVSSRVRKAVGLPSTQHRTITMLVADGRIDRRVLLSARSLHQAGWRVRVIASPHPDPRDDDQRMFPEIEIVRIVPSRYLINIHRIGARTSLGARGSEWHRVYPHYFHFLALAARHPAQIFVAHDLPVLASAIVAAQMFGSHVVYDAHELYPEQHHFKSEHVDALRHAEAALIGYADLVTTVNESIAHELAERYRIDQPAVILNAPAAAGGSLPLPRNTLIRDKLGLSVGHRILLFQGGLSPNRNLEALTRAIALVRQLEIVLVFLGPDGGKRRELEQIAGKLGLLGSRIYFLDPVPQDALLSWTAGADIGIIPYPPIDLNSRLCTPNKLFEFIVAEVPILANDLPELRRFVVGNGFGIVRSMRNPRAIASAIDEMMSSDPSAWRAALRARSEKFVWDLQGKEIVRLYELFRTSQLGETKEIASTSEITSATPTGRAVND